MIIMCIIREKTLFKEKHKIFGCLLKQELKGTNPSWWSQNKVFRGISVFDISKSKYYVLIAKFAKSVKKTRNPEPIFVN